MDQRLEKALDFSNYALTINNQKRNIRNRVAQLQIVHYLGGAFIADHETISFIKTLIDMKHKSFIIIDSKNNPITVKSLKELLEKLIDAYTTATAEFNIENEKIKKARNIKKIMDW
tara:strand:+ start:1847 stop:2194 length:348 start_codon:yes stop_codon:yes gene_type:complete